ncbi:MAG: hypothetical protein ABIY55_01150 [Kofleriaceae bacterium]
MAASERVQRVLSDVRELLAEDADVGTSWGEEAGFVLEPFRRPPQAG